MVGGRHLPRFPPAVGRGNGRYPQGTPHPRLSQGTACKQAGTWDRVLWPHPCGVSPARHHEGLSRGYTAAREALTLHPGAMKDSETFLLCPGTGHSRPTSLDLG